MVTVCVQYVGYIACEQSSVLKGIPIDESRCDDKNIFVGNTTQGRSVLMHNNVSTTYLNPNGTD